MKKKTQGCITSLPTAPLQSKINFGKAEQFRKPNNIHDVILTGTVPKLLHRLTQRSKQNSLTYQQTSKFTTYSIQVGLPAFSVRADLINLQ